MAATANTPAAERRAIIRNHHTGLIDVIAQRKSADAHSNLRYANKATGFPRILFGPVGQLLCMTLKQLEQSHSQDVQPLQPASMAGYWH